MRLISEQAVQLPYAGEINTTLRTARKETLALLFRETLRRNKPVSRLEATPLFTRSNFAVLPFFMSLPCPLHSDVAAEIASRNSFFCMNSAGRGDIGIRFEQI
jgi:hypothetical protein